MEERVPTHGNKGAWNPGDKDDPPLTYPPPGTHAAAAAAAAAEHHLPASRDLESPPAPDYVPPHRDTESLTLPEHAPPPRDPKSPPLSEHVSPTGYPESLSLPLDVSPTSKNNNSPPLPLPPALRKDTYLIQLPKDQIYRVPPPENALIVERYRNPDEKKDGPCISKLAWIILGVILIIIAVIVGVVIAYFNKKPVDPSFAILKFSVKNSTSHHKNKIEFTITLNTENTNSDTNMHYGKGSSALLLYKQKIIAKGHTSALDLDHSSSLSFKIVLDVLKTGLPRDLKNNMKGKSHKDKKLEFKLLMNVPTKMKGRKTRIIDLAVECDLTVNTLKKGTRVLSQECEIEH